MNHTLHFRTTITGIADHALSSHPNPITCIAICSDHTGRKRQKREQNLATRDTTKITTPSVSRPMPETMVTVSTPPSTPSHNFITSVGRIHRDSEHSNATALKTGLTVVGEKNIGTSSSTVFHTPCSYSNTVTNSEIPGIKPLRHEQISSHRTTVSSDSMRERTGEANKTEQDGGRKSPPP